MIKSSCMNCNTKVFSKDGKLLNGEANSTFNKIRKIPIILKYEDDDECNGEKHILCDECELSVKEDIFKRYNVKNPKKVGDYFKYKKIIELKCCLCIKTHDVRFEDIKCILNSTSCCIF